jgi:hypothetical protein
MAESKQIVRMLERQRREHKQAMIAGRRKARDAHDVVTGLAREIPDENFVPAIGVRGDRQEPRLITKPIKR